MISQTGIPLGSGPLKTIHTTTFDQQEDDQDDGPKQKEIDPTRDRREPVDVETSIRYLKSKGNNLYKVSSQWVQVIVSLNLCTPKSRSPWLSG